MFDIVIIGGGIVGLATGLKIKQARANLKVAIVEKENKIAQHQTGNNSGVIHSGLYYKPGSMKATNCVNGYRQLLDFARQHDIPFELCGKIVVATEKSQLPVMETLFQRGIENGLEGIRRLPEGELKEFEPYVRGIGGIHVPQTGIIDYKAVAASYAVEFQKLGGEIHLDSAVKNITPTGKTITLETKKSTIPCKMIVNCAGLYADKIATLAGVTHQVKIIPFRGEYFMLKPNKQHLVKNLIYPVPDPNFPFLGVHFTRMIGGGIEAGPNAVLAFRREGYKKAAVSIPEFYESLSWPGFRKVAVKYWRTGFGELYRSFSKSAFTKALQGLLPDVMEDDLQPGGAGVRAQACDIHGGLLDDFYFVENEFSVNEL
jgi:L-2-hydroxyglutarate oxidase